MAPRSSLLALEDLGAGDISRWRELAAAAAEPNPFFEPEYLLPLASSLGALGAVSLVVVADGQRWVACLPVHRTRGWHRIPLRALVAWRGQGLLPALIGTPLIAGEHLDEASCALLDTIVGHPGTAYAILDVLVEGGPVLAAVQRAIAERGLPSREFSRQDRAFLSRRSDEDYMQRALAPKHRRNLRSQSRRLAAELGAELEVLDLAGDPGAVAELIALEGRSRLAERGSVLASDPAQAAFFAEICASFAARGQLQLLALRANGQTVAMKCSLLADPGVFYLKIAYEEDYARFSPGIQLEAAALAAFHRRAASQWIDSCAFPGNETFNRLLPERRRLVTLSVAPRTARGLAASGLIAVARRLRERAMRTSG